MKDYPYPIRKETPERGDPALEELLTEICGIEPAFVQLHRKGEPCYVKADKVSYIGPMLGVGTSYCVIDGCPLIIDEGVEEIRSMLCDQ